LAWYPQQHPPAGAGDLVELEHLVHRRDPVITRTRDNGDAVAVGVASNRRTSTVAARQSPVLATSSEASMRVTPLSRAQPHARRRPLPAPQRSPDRLPPIVAATSSTNITGALTSNALATRCHPAASATALATTAAASGAAKTATPAGSAATNTTWRAQRLRRGQHWRTVNTAMRPWAAQARSRPCAGEHDKGAQRTDRRAQPPEHGDACDGTAETVRRQPRQRGKVRPPGQQRSRSQGPPRQDGTRPPDAHTRLRSDRA